MNTADRLELDAIRSEHHRLRRSVDTLDQRIDLLGRRLESSVVARVEPARTSEPPPLPPAAVARDAQPSTAPVLTTASTVVEPAPALAFATPEPAARPAFESAVSGTVSPPSKSDAPAATTLPTAVETEVNTTNEPLELRVGTFWMARIGIVILLTGLVFLGNYAYHRIVPLLGPWGKLALLSLAGAGLSGLGLWLERSRETMRNYGRVLLAGGAATLYYTAYAAHFVERLRVIESPILGGTLLLTLAGGFIWYADRKRSEALAVPALLLAYYTSAINAIGSFTLFSNLLLTGAAVFFLVRHRWTRLSHLSLVATYGSYAFWRFHQVVQTGGGSEFGLGIAFLAGYWVLFTAAVFLAAPEVLRGPARLAFLTTNNGAFFAFGVHHFAVHRPDAFWLFATGFGAVLLGLAVAAARLRSEERTLDGAYLAQGLALVAIGFAQKFTGPQLAVLLAVESAVLLVNARSRQGLICSIASGLCALGACGLALEQLSRQTVAPTALGGTVAGLLFVNVWLAKRRKNTVVEGSFDAAALGFAALGLSVVGATIWRAVPEPWQPTALAAAAGLSLAALRLRLPEIALPGQGYLLLSLAVFLTRHAETPIQPWWIPLPLVATALGLMHWWQRQRTIELPAELRGVAQLTAAGVAAVAGVSWMHGFFHGDQWLLATSAAAFGTLLYGIFTRGWALALAGQVFTLLATASFVSSLLFGHPAWTTAMMPIANLAACSFLATQLADRRLPALPGELNLTLVAQIYRLAALTALGAWAFEYIETPWRVAFFTGLGAGLIFLGAGTRNQERAGAGAIFAITGLAFFWCRLGQGVAVQDLVAILAVPASLRLGKRLAGELPLLAEARHALVGAAMASTWLWVTRWITWHGDSSRLTAVWALLALAIFAAGLGLRERMYRLGGFAILALAVARLFFVDVWGFDALYRIISFLVLGAVLLVLSFVYNRYAETLRRWL